jgi:Family of unknown function (DUF5681)
MKKSSISNLTPWKKGYCPNRKGRPKNLPEIKELLTEALAEKKNGISAAQAIIRSMIVRAIKGDVKAAEMLFDRLFGKPKQQLDIDSTVRTLNVEILSETELAVVLALNKKLAAND